MRASAASRVARGLVVGVSLAASGAATALLLVTPTVPVSLEEVTGPDSVPVSFQDFSDPLPVELAFGRAPDVAIAAAAGGQVTAYSCRAGGAFESGTSSLAIDGAPILSVATATPLWRDLARGDTGDDVRALQEEVTRLGFPLVADGILGDGAIDAVERLLERASGRNEELTSIPRARLLWIPGASVVTATCPLSPGGPVEQGGTVAVVGGSVASLRLVALPAEALAGERRLLVDDAVLTPSAEGEITTAADLRAFSETGSARAALATEGVTTVSAQYVLAASVRVGVVPPSAVFALAGDRGCVLAGDSVLPVQVVSSELGRSAVVFVDGGEPASVASAPDDRACS